MRTRLLAVAVVVALVVLGGLLYWRAQPMMLTAAIAWNGSLWYVVDTPRHDPQGIRSVSGDLHEVVIDLDLDATAVRTFVATPDEAFTAAGYRVGASVDTDRVELYLYGDGAIPTKEGKVANLWLYGVFDR
jgi:hypothetical protein